MKKNTIIWIDILHIPQLNYYLPLIEMLSQKGALVYVTVLGRGKLPIIAQKELSGKHGVLTTTIGRHRMQRWSIIFEANLFRLIRLLFWVSNKKIDIAFSNGSHVGIMGKIFGFPAYEFEDDPQAQDYKLMCRYATQNHSLLFELPNGYTLDKRDKLVHVLKEWAYLNLNLFHPNQHSLEKYNIAPKEYIFLREVSVGTFNYSDQAAGAIRDVQHLISQLKTADGKPMKVLFSLEEKHRRHEYPADWILLQEPIEDIHSLIYYAAGLVSSGDSMAREAALLGIPAYYLGVRHSMPANLAASKVANLQNEKTMPFSDWLKGLQANRVQLEQQQEQMRKKIDEEFIDINEYMLSLVEQVEKSKN